jgi:uncharacterized protein YjiS (DUF1127 family)
MTTMQSALRAMHLRHPANPQHRKFVEMIRMWRRRARERQEFLDLDDYLLRDIGLTRDDAIRLTRKTFWRA